MVLLLCSAAVFGQATFKSVLTNNTSACPSTGKLPSHCRSSFGGHSDDRPAVATPLFNAPAGNVSNEDLHTYLNNGTATKIFANIMTGFCTESGAEYCHDNVKVGYASDDKKTVAAQAEDMIRRHIDGAIMTWEGSGTTSDGASMRMQSYLDSKHCHGQQNCDLMYVIMFDGPSVNYKVTDTGIPGTSGGKCAGRTGGAYESCVVKHLRNDMCWMNGKHWGDEAYQKFEGHPIVMIFPNETVIPGNGTAPSWADVWKQISDWNNNLPGNCAESPYNANNGVPLLVFENAKGFTRPGSGGAYYWVAPAGTDPASSQFVSHIDVETNERSLDGFYRAAQQHPDKLAWGAAFKGFNSSRSKWGANRIMDQQCGMLWMRTLEESNRYYNATALPFLQIATWNDYNEGTEIESGIDNCYSVAAHAEGSQLLWSLQSRAQYASLATVSHIEIYETGNGNRLKLLTQAPAAQSGTYPLSELRPGKHVLFVRMVGRNSILNRISQPLEVSVKAP